MAIEEEAQREAVKQKQLEEVFGTGDGVGRILKVNVSDYLRSVEVFRSSFVLFNVCRTLDGVVFFSHIGS